MYKITINTSKVRVIYIQVKASKIVDIIDFKMDNSETDFETMCSSLRSKLYHKGYISTCDELYNKNPHKNRDAVEGDASDITSTVYILFHEIIINLNKFSTKIEIDENKTCGRQICIKIGSITIFLIVDLEFSGSNFSHGEIHPTSYKSYDPKPQTITINIDAPRSFKKEIGYKSRYFARDQQRWSKNGFSSIFTEIKRISDIYSKKSTTINNIETSVFSEIEGISDIYSKKSTTIDNIERKWWSFFGCF